MFVHVLVVSLLVAGSFAAPTETPVKPIVDAKIAANTQRAAAPLDEQNQARTHHSLINRLKPSSGGYPYPGHPMAYAPYPSISGYPSVPYSPTYQQASYISAYQPASHFSAYQLAPYISGQQPVSYVPAASATPYHVPTSVPIQVPVAPVHSQTTYTKPVVSYAPTMLNKPGYAISQQVLHQPHITEAVEVIKRPVVFQVEEHVHRPVFTMYEQVTKIPTHTMHVVKKPTFDAAVQEVYQPPVHLHSQRYDILHKPTTQVMQLPPQYVQPYTPQVVHMPSVHHQTDTTLHQTPVSVHEPVVQPAMPVVHPSPVVPVIHPSPAVPTFRPQPPISIVHGQYLPASSYGWAGSSYGGSLLGHEGAIGSLGTYGGYGSSWTGGSDDASYYFTPSTCRGADCQRDVQGGEFGYWLWPGYPTPPKNQQETGGSPQQPTQGRTNDEPVAQGVEPQTDQPTDNDAMIAALAQRLLNNQEFHNIVERASADLEKEVKSAEMDETIRNMVNQLSDEQKAALLAALQKTKVEDPTTTSAPPQQTNEPKKDTPKE